MQQFLTKEKMLPNFSTAISVTQFCNMKLNSYTPVRFWQNQSTNIECGCEEHLNGTSTVFAEISNLNY